KSPLGLLSEFGQSTTLPIRLDRPTICPLMIFLSVFLSCLARSMCLPVRMWFEQKSSKLYFLCNTPNRESFPNQKLAD
ncbi:MAG TPA: hypothetical protein VMT34_02645, partial [Aggregatilineales bacterium]|nr:hypothetical protein [Aggregatilineales bacterium]